MSEDAIKSAEEKLHELITNGNIVLTKLKRTLNAIWYVGGSIAVVFFISFVDVRSRMATLEESKASKIQIEETYAKKTDVVFLQNNIYDMNNSAFVYSPDTDEQKLELSYTRALRQFMNDVSRGVSNPQ